MEPTAEEVKAAYDLIVKDAIKKFTVKIAVVTVIAVGVVVAIGVVASKLNESEEASEPETSEE